jgi:virginiamycin B lyase
MTVGADGASWSTEHGMNKIYRITTAGAISEFLLPTPNSAGVGGITVGSDGALWFVEWNNVGNKIGRITTRHLYQTWISLRGPTVCFGASGDGDGQKGLRP